MTSTKEAGRGLLALVIIAVLALIGYGILNMPDQRSTGQRIGDAIDALPNGPDKAARQLEKRTPGQKLGDAVKDTGDTIKQNTNR